MRNLIIAITATTVLLAVTTTIGWSAALAIVVVVALTGVVVAGLLRPDHDPASTPGHERVGAGRAWQDWRTDRVREGRPTPMLLVRRLPELLAATVGGLHEWITTRRRSDVKHEIGPFRRRYNAVLRRRPASWSTDTDDPAAPDTPTKPAKPEPTRGADGSEGDRPAPPQASPRAPHAEPERPEPAAPEPSDNDNSTATEEEPVSNTIAALSGALGTAGRASISGLVIDWETSVEARENPETFTAWLHSQAAGARHASALVPDLVKQFHGRGPAGHVGVPDQILEAFVKAFEEARAAEAVAYEQFANEYAAYVELAEAELTQTYGREVLASAHAAHQNRGAA